MTKKKLTQYGVFTASILFYLFWFAVDGVRMESDTNGYVNFSLAREPLYPTWLALFRGIFGTADYFAWVGIFQCLFWGIVTGILCVTLYEKLNLKEGSCWILLGICFAVNLMTRFFAGRRALYALDIASEGICIPLFLLFFLQLYLYWSELKKRNLAEIILYSVLLISTRKQMYIVMPIAGAVYLCLWIWRKIKIKNLLFLWGTIVCTFIGSVFVDVGYNWIVRGDAVRHSTDSSAALITVMYVAQKEDAVNIQDEAVRKLFEEIVDKKDAKGWGYAEAGRGWKTISNHYAQYFDLIAFELVNPAFYDFLAQQGITDYVEAEQAFGKLNDYMLSSIFKANFEKVIGVFAANSISGFCNTVLKDSALLVPAIAVLYLLYIAVMIILFKKEGKDSREAILGFVVLVCIVMNVLAVSALIFSQSRYMIYNMPLFYCALYIMLRRISFCRKNNWARKKSCDMIQ